MKRLIGCLVVFLVLFAGTLSATQYTVLPGDTGWELAREYYRDATKWQKVVDANPFLKTPGRVFEKNGRIILILKPGERLEGLEWMGMKAPIAVSIAELGLMAPSPKIVEVSSPIWPWLLGALAFIALIAGASALAKYNARRFQAEALAAEQEDRRRDAEARLERKQRLERERELELSSDPVTSGTPFVPGGIPATDPERLRNFFTAQAVESYANRTGNDPMRVQVEQIGPIESGLMYGDEGEVGYLDARGFRPRRIPEPGIAAYQGRFRFPDGTEQLLQCLVGCMNPTRGYSGDVYRGYTFVPTGIVVPAPEPVVVTTPEPPAVMTTGVTEVMPVNENDESELLVEEGVVRIEFRPATDDKPMMILMTGVNEKSNATCEIRSGSVMLRCTPLS